MYRRAFSLIELVVVLLMLGALTTMAIGQYLDSQKLSKRSIFESNINEIAKALSSYRSNKVLLGTNTVLYPTSLSDPQFKMLFEQEPRNPYTSKPMLTDNSVDSGIQYVSDGTSYKLCVVQRDVDDVNNNGVVEEVLPLSTKTACIGNTQTSVGVTFARNSVAYTSNGAQVGVNVPRFEQGKFGQGILIEEGTTNLLPANDARGKTLFSPNNNTYTTNSLSSSFGLSDSYSIMSVQKTTGQNSGFYSPYYNVTVGQTYTFSYYVYNTTSTIHNFVAILIFYDSADTSTSVYSNNTVAYPNMWTKVNVTAIIPSGTVKCRIAGRENGVNSNIGDTYYYDNFQLEAKPYATSWTDGTRAADNLTVSTSSIINPLGVWTLEWIVKTATISNINHHLGLGAIWGPNQRISFHLRRNVSPYKVAFWSSVNGGVWYESSVTVNNNSDIYVAFTYNGAGTLKIYVNGQLAGTFSIVIPNDTYTTLALGRGNKDIGSEMLNSIIDEFRISNLARTDAEIQALYQSNQPLPVDAWTTLKADFNGNLDMQSGIIQ